MVDARITLSNLSDEYVENPQKDFPVGMLVHGRWDLLIFKWSCKLQICSLAKLTKLCRILSTDPSSGRVEASLRKTTGSKLEKLDDISYSDLHVGDIIDGQVKRVESFGLFVTIRRSELVRYHYTAFWNHCIFCFVNILLQVGLCHVSELSDEPVVDINSCYKAGDMVKAKILKVRFIFFRIFILPLYVLKSITLF